MQTAAPRDIRHAAQRATLATGLMPIVASNVSNERLFNQSHGPVAWLQCGQ